VSVEKVPQLMLAAEQRSRYKQARVLDAAAFHHFIWRPAAHDGAPIPRLTIPLSFCPNSENTFD
jgi:hypothetical protein